ncbi:MAG: hypothetical protein Q9157_006308 [Trypethelium eluteriae]
MEASLTKATVAYISVIRGKGEGLVFLLCGPPGCGKTLTAELMAEECKKPLMRISFGNLGHRPDEVDRNLQALLELSLKGSATVLIDEADAMLSKRSTGGVTVNSYHNIMVSIFLRHLEYFSGVLFLTTNHATEFDDAVNSRVVTLHYRPLNSKDRAKLWKAQLMKKEQLLAECNIDSFCEELGEDFALDGREIKNLVTHTMAIRWQRKQHVSKQVIQEIYNLTHRET